MKKEANDNSSLYDPTKSMLMDDTRISRESTPEPMTVPTPPPMRFVERKKKLPPPIDLEDKPKDKTQGTHKKKKRVNFADQAVDTIRTPSSNGDFGLKRRHRNTASRSSRASH